MQIERGPVGDVDVVRKTALSTVDERRLVREAALLATTEERGLRCFATMLSLDETTSPDGAGPDGAGRLAVLVTRDAGPLDLAAAPPLPHAAIAGLAHSVALHLTALHEAGLVHGGVGPAHVAIDAAGTVTLLSPGRGGRIGDPAPEPEHPGQRLDPADDVAGAGALLDHLLRWADAGAGGWEEVARAGRAQRRRRTPLVPAGLPGTGARLRRGPPIAAPPPGEALLSLADAAQHAEAARRPSALGLAAALVHRVPDLRLPTAEELGLALSGAAGEPGHALPAGGEADTADARPTSAPPSAPAGQPSPALRAQPERSRGGRRGAEARAALLERLGGATVPAEPDRAVADGFGRVEEGAPSEGRGRSLRRPLVAIGVVAAAAATVAAIPAFGPGSPARPPRPEPCLPLAATPATVVALPGECPAPVAVEPTGIAIGAARYAITPAGSGAGASADAPPGSHVVIGDWDCDGQPTPATLAGDIVVVYDAWPGEGAEQPGRSVGRVPGAVDLVDPGAPHGSCEPVVVRRADGTTTSLDGRRT